LISLDPVIVIALTKAIDFLFEQAGVLLAEFRGTQKSRGEVLGESHPSHQQIEKATTKDDVLSWQPKNEKLRDIPQEVDSYLNQIYQYRANKRNLEKQIAVYGGYTFAPIIVQNQLSLTEEEVKTTCQKLKDLVEEVYGKKINIIGLS